MGSRSGGSKYNRLSGIQTPQNECLRCNKLFKTTSGLAQHIESSHRVKKDKETEVSMTYSCVQCEMTFSADSQLQQHISAKHGKAKCHICFNHFETNEHLQKHVYKKHRIATNDNDTKMTRNKKDDEIKAVNNSEETNIKLHNGGNAEIPKEITLIENVTANDATNKAIGHKSTISSSQVADTCNKNPLSGDFCCSECDIGFRSAAGLERHVESAHKKSNKNSDGLPINVVESKPTSNITQDVRFNKRKSLEIEKRNSFVLGEKRNSLVLLKRASLDMEFKAEAHLVENRKSKEYSFSQVKADVGKKFKECSNLWTKSIDDPGNVAMHKCQKCGEAFTSINLLHNHNVAEHPLKCSFCVNKFPNSESLNVHMIAKHPEVIEAQKTPLSARSTDRIDRLSWHINEKQTENSNAKQHEKHNEIRSLSPQMKSTESHKHQTFQRNAQAKTESKAHYSKSPIGLESRSPPKRSSINESPSIRTPSPEKQMSSSRSYSPNKRSSTLTKEIQDTKETSARPVKCPDCDHFFKNKELLQIHSSGMHNRCSICNKKFNAAEEMAIHMTKAHPLGQNLPKKDSKKSNDWRANEFAVSASKYASKDVNDNMKNKLKEKSKVHNSETPIKEKATTKSTEVKQGYKKTTVKGETKTETNTPNGVPCPCCEMILISVHSLKKHLNKYHGQFPCNQCPSNFYTEQGRTEHTRVQHQSNLNESSKKAPVHEALNKVTNTVKCTERPKSASFSDNLEVTLPIEKKNSNEPLRSILKIPRPKSVDILLEESTSQENKANSDIRQSTIKSRPKSDIFETSDQNLKSGNQLESAISSEFMMMKDILDPELSHRTWGSIVEMTMKSNENIDALNMAWNSRTGTPTLGSISNTNRTISPELSWRATQLESSIPEASSFEEKFCKEFNGVNHKEKEVKSNKKCDDAKENEYLDKNALPASEAIDKVNEKSISREEKEMSNKHDNLDELDASKIDSPTKNGDEPSAPVSLDVTVSYPCHICDTVANSAKSIKKHLNKHHGTWSCTECPAKFYFENGLQAHIDAKHSIGKMAESGTAEEAIRLLGLHLKKMSEMVDSNTIKRASLAAIEVMSEANMEALAESGDGPDIISTDILLNSEQYLQNSCNEFKTVPHFRCEHCSMAFYSGKSLKKHLNEKHGLFKCELCQSTFYSAMGLRSHCNAKHVGSVTTENGQSTVINGRFENIIKQIKVNANGEPLNPTASSCTNSICEKDKEKSKDDLKMTTCEHCSNVDGELGSKQEVRKEINEEAKKFVNQTKINTEKEDVSFDEMALMTTQQLPRGESAAAALKKIARPSSQSRRGFSEDAVDFLHQEEVYETKESSELKTLHDDGKLKGSLIPDNNHLANMTNSQQNLQAANDSIELNAQVQSATEESQLNPQQQFAPLSVIIPHSALKQKKPTATVEPMPKQRPLSMYDERNPQIKSIQEDRLPISVNDILVSNFPRSYLNQSFDIDSTIENDSDMLIDQNLDEESLFDPCSRDDSDTTYTGTNLGSRLILKQATSNDLVVSPSNKDRNSQMKFKKMMGQNTSTSQNFTNQSFQDDGAVGQSAEVVSSSCESSYSTISEISTRDDNTIRRSSLHTRSKPDHLSNAQSTENSKKSTVGSLYCNYGYSDSQMKNSPVNSTPILDPNEFNHHKRRHWNDPGTNSSTQSVSDFRQHSSSLSSAQRPTSGKLRKPSGSQSVNDFCRLSRTSRELRELDSSSAASRIGFFDTPSPEGKSQCCVPASGSNKQIDKDDNKVHDGKLNKKDCSIM